MYFYIWDCATIYFSRSTPFPWLTSHPYLHLYHRNVWQRRLWGCLKADNTEKESWRLLDRAWDWFWSLKNKAGICENWLPWWCVLWLNPHANNKDSHENLCHATLCLSQQIIHPPPTDKPAISAWLPSCLSSYSLTASPTVPQEDLPIVRIAYLDDSLMTTLVIC